MNHSWLSLLYFTEWWRLNAYEDCHSLGFKDKQSYCHTQIHLASILNRRQKIHSCHYMKTSIYDLNQYRHHPAWNWILWMSFLLESLGKEPLQQWSHAALSRLGCLWGAEQWSLERWAWASSSRAVLGWCCSPANESPLSWQRAKLYAVLFNTVETRFYWCFWSQWEKRHMN